MKKIISALISKLKGEKYLIDSDFDMGALLGVVFDRGVQVMRGAVKRLRIKKCGGLLFCGKRVKIRSGRKLYLGRNVIFEDNVFINALSKSGVIIGRNVSIGRNSIIECTGVIRELGEGLVIGDNVGIAPNAFIAVRGRVTIGENTIFGPGVSIHAENHLFGDPFKPIRLQGAGRKGITIGRDCWIGSKVVILDGVKIGNGCVVAAGAVVNGDIPDYAVAGGVPAKIIKYRGAVKNQMAEAGVQ